MTQVTARFSSAWPVASCAHKTCCFVYETVAGGEEKYSQKHKKTLGVHKESELEEENILLVTDILND